MRSSLQVGDAAEMTITVTEDMCPAIGGRVVHRIYSTWSMGHHIELAARALIQDHLEEGEETIGTHLSIEHLAPVPVGHAVRIRAKIVELDRKTLVCLATAFHVRADGETVAGRGRHIQRVVSKRTLDSLVKRAAGPSPPVGTRTP